jgi:hypothetical protein
MSMQRISVTACFTAVLLLAAYSHAQAPPAGPAGAYRIAGTVVSSADGHPLSRARVSVTDTNNVRKPISLLSAEDGSFSFTGLPAGKFSLQGAKRGFLTRGYEQHETFWTAIVTGAGIDTEHLVLRLLPDAYIFGKVFDENSEPVRGARVTLYRVAHEEGTAQVQQNRSVIADDLGAYELGPQEPGTYFLEVQAEPWYAIHPPRDSRDVQFTPPRQVDAALDVVYPVTYFADTTDPEAATPVQLKGGERLQADVHLAPAPSLSILVHVPEGSAPQLQRTGLGGDMQGVQTRAQPVGPGVWELSGVPQGNYSISISGRHGDEMQTTSITAVNQGQEIDASGVQSNGTVDVSAHIADEKAFPPQLAVGLRAPGGILRYWQIADAKGIAHLQNVAAGRYEVLSWTNGTRYSVSNVSVEGTEQAGQMLTVNSGTKTTAVVTLAVGQASVEGVVKLAGKPVSAAMVVLVPQNPEQHRDLFRRDQSDLDGTFKMLRVVPGDYTLLAIENGWEMDWSRPDVIAPYLKRGRQVRVVAQPNSSLKVSEPIEAQSH